MTFFLVENLVENLFLSKTEITKCESKQTTTDILKSCQEQIADTGHFLANVSLKTKA